jgi:hypothetical protein
MKFKAEQVSGAPTFCHECNRQLMRAPGKGLGLFYAVHLTHKSAGHRVRMHDQCARRVIRDETDYRLAAIEG